MFGADDPVPDGDHAAKVTFDVGLHSTPRWRAVRADVSLARIGGPLPLEVLARRGLMSYLDAFCDVDIVVALSDELASHVSRIHGNVHTIPNGIDLDAWEPLTESGPRARQHRPLRVGIAAALEDPDLRLMKGHHLAADACRIVGARLLPIGVGHGQVDHRDMTAAFYSRIDCLLHPVSHGKEGSSNVIMEALALGIPVVTTRHAGYHGERLADGVDALLVRRDVDDIARALTRLRRDRELRAHLALGARRFAVEHHDIRQVGRQYDALLRPLSGPRP